MMMPQLNIAPRGRSPVRAFPTYGGDGDETPRGMMAGLKIDTGKAGMQAWQDYDTQQDQVSTPRNMSGGVVESAWARLRSKSPVASPPTALPAPTKCVWREAERGLPSLPRAWRTPDPSPTRTGGVTPPAAKLAELYEDLGPLASPTPAPPRAAREPQESHAWARMRTPSPECAYPMWGDGLAAVPPPSHFPLLLSQQLAAPGPDASAELSVPPPPAAAGPSAGSCGHPDFCGAPCKYFWKSSGCKDGAACVRCHVCKWTRPRKKAEAATKPEEPPKPEGVPRLRLSEIVF